MIKQCDFCKGSAPDTLSSYCPHLVALKGFIQQLAHNWDMDASFNANKLLMNKMLAKSIYELMITLRPKCKGIDDGSKEDTRTD